MNGRIWFAKNPWPKGHAIKRAKWSGRIDPSGSLLFDFDIKSADYYAGDRMRDADEEEDADSDWESKVVWGNYHACWLSSTQWGNAGIPIASAKKKLDWKKLSAVRADPMKKSLPEDDDFTPALGIYLLGHDGVADHAIRFTRTGKTWSIDWKARIALVYAGDYDLDHRMTLELRGMTFDGFAIPKGMKPAAARALFDAAVVDPAKWKIEKRRFVRA
jgi:hypothetical protein